MAIRYSAFISSHYTTMKQERAEVIDALLDHRIIPICMEHFTAASNEKFEALKRQIDEADIFIMILGDKFGSTDDNGSSWTQLEYEYAVNKNMPVYVILSNSYLLLKNKESKGEELSLDERKQLQFGESISFAQEIDEKGGIYTIVSQIVSNTVFSKCVGWTRECNVEDLEWEKNNRIYDISGKWYHIHFKPDCKNYIRIGTVNIEQTFNKASYRKLKMSASNYNIDKNTYNNIRRRDKKNCILEVDRCRKTSWHGEYDLKESFCFVGLYEAHREFRGPYDNWEATPGVYYGVHRFSIVDEDKDNDSGDVTNYIEGTFQDLAPSQKMGKVFLFRNEQERNDFAFNILLNSEEG